MKKSLILTRIAALLLMPLSSDVFALQVGGIEIPERITQEVSQQQLVLNGAGVRGKFIFDIYVGALYLTKHSDSVEQILADTSPGRVMMHFLYKKIEKDKMRSAWSGGFEDNLDAEELSALKPEIDTFNAAFGDTVKGDVVIIDFLSDKTTRVRINGVEKARIMGAGFQRALLSVWPGESPVDRGLKRAMLGRE